MNVFSVLTLLGGLALFLYGMSVMSSGLERMAGGRLEQILRRMTANRFKGLALGAGVTAVIQSSSAVTVMLVGLVNSGIMELSQAVSVTFGANIGTTMTAWILSLAGIGSGSIWLELLQPKNFSPVVALIGVILIMGKKQRKKDAGAICVGFAVLMYGMTFMSDAVAPLADMPQFTSVLTMFENPLLGVLTGLVFTAVIQSSSASVGVLQALSMTGAISYQVAIPIIMGQNIGTCVSAVLSCIGTGRSAKRVAVVHVLFNTIGTLACLAVWCTADVMFHFPFAQDAVTPVHIAVIHSVFNIVTTLILLPFMKSLERMAYLIIPDTEKREQAALFDERLLAVPSVAVAKALRVTISMADIAKDAVIKAAGLLERFDDSAASDVAAMETQLDHFEDELGTYLVKLSRREVSEADSQEITKMLHTISDFERIGDHADNLIQVAREIRDKNISFSSEAQEELDRLTQAVLEIVSVTAGAFACADVSRATSVEPLEQVIDMLIAGIKSRHVSRLRSGDCTIMHGFVLNDLLMNYERISDHCSNIAVAVIMAQDEAFDTHSYLRKIKSEQTGHFAKLYEQYLDKYAL